MHAPALCVAIPLTAGAAAGILGAGIDLPAATPAWCALLALVAGVAAFLDRNDFEVALAIAAGSLAAGAALGMTSARAACHPSLLTWYESHPGEQRDAPVVVEGVLREDGALAEYGAMLALDVRSVVTRDPAGREHVTPVAGGVRLTVTGAAAPLHVDHWRARRTIRVPAVLRLPSAYRNPGAGDDRAALARRGVVLVGTVKSATLVEVRHSGSPIAEAAGRVRAWTRRVLTERVGLHASRSAGVASAILIGDRSALPDEDERRLQEAGTYHVIAISGGNIAILSLIVLGTFRLAQVPARGAWALTIVALLFYAELTGAPASVGRAVTAAVVYLAGRILDHQGAPMNALAVAAVAALAWSPLAALDAGFLLSFGATAGILVGTPRLLRWPARRARTSRARLVRAAVLAPAGVVAASVCAEIVLGPVSASLFSRVTAAGLLLNLAAIPLMAVVQAASLATLAAEAVGPPAASVCGLVVHYAAAGLVDSSRLVEVAPWLSRNVAPPAWPVVAVYYTSTLVALFARRPRRAAVLTAAAAGSVIVFGPPGLTRGALTLAAPGHVRVVIFDVGQGDATVVVLPGGRALLVDAGGLPGTTFDLGERVVAPALRAVGVRRLEELVITHADPDHIGGARSIVRHFRPRTIREGVPVPPHEGLRALQADAGAAGVWWRRAQAGGFERFGEVELRVHHPPLPDWERQRVRNDDSVVLEVRFGRVSILLPGDIGSETEREVLSRLDLPPIVILKAGHHGSATSSTQAFVDAVRPAAAIVSAGANNRFGHPSALVVERFRRAGAVLFRTDEDGAVIVDTDGRRAEVRGWTGRRVIFERQPQSR